MMNQEENRRQLIYKMSSHSVKCMKMCSQTGVIFIKIYVSFVSWLNCFLLINLASAHSYFRCKKKKSFDVKTTFYRWDKRNHTLFGTAFYLKSRKNTTCARIWNYLTCRFISTKSKAISLNLNSRWPKKKGSTTVGNHRIHTPLTQIKANIINTEHSQLVIGPVEWINAKKTKENKPNLPIQTNSYKRANRCCCCHGL